jgi:hypothetical protein
MGIEKVCHGMRGVKRWVEYKYNTTGGWWQLLDMACQIYIYTSVAIYVQLIMQFKSSNVTLMISWSKFGQKWREKRIRWQMLRALYEEYFTIYLMQRHVNRRNIKMKWSWDMRSLMSGVRVWALEQIFLEVRSASLGPGADFLGSEIIHAHVYALKCNILKNVFCLRDMNFNNLI